MKDIYALLGVSSLLCIMYLVRRASSFQPGIVYTTESSMANAKQLAHQLIKSKFAACVQLKEISSIYEWKGKIEEEKEIQLTIKCDLQNYDALESFIKDKHTYDTPQIIMVKAVAGSPEYLDFLKQGTTQNNNIIQ